MCLPTVYSCNWFLLYLQAMAIAANLNKLRNAGDQIWYWSLHNKSLERNPHKWPHPPLLLHPSCSLRPVLTILGLGHILSIPTSEDRHWSEILWEVNYFNYFCHYYPKYESWKIWKPELNKFCWTFTMLMMKIGHSENWLILNGLSLSLMTINS